MTRNAGDNQKLGRSKRGFFLPSEREWTDVGLWTPLQNYETIYPVVLSHLV